MIRYVATATIGEGDSLFYYSTPTFSGGFVFVVEDEDPDWLYD